MESTERENYFSIYMRKKANSTNKKHKNSQSMYFKNSNPSKQNYNCIPCIHSIIIKSSRKEKNSVSFCKKYYPESAASSDKDKKIDRIEAKISGLVDLIENFKHQYIYKDDLKIKKELKKLDKDHLYLNELNLKKNSISGSLTSDSIPTMNQTRPLSSCSESKKASEKNFFKNKTPKKSSSQINCVSNSSTTCTKKGTATAIKKVKKINNNKFKSTEKKYKNFFYSKEQFIKFSKIPKELEKNCIDFISSRKNNSKKMSIDASFKVQGIKIQNFKKLFSRFDSYKCQSDRGKNK